MKTFNKQFIQMIISNLESYNVEYQAEDTMYVLTSSQHIHILICHTVGEEDWILIIDDTEIEDNMITLLLDEEEYNSLIKNIKKYHSKSLDIN